MHVYKKIPLIEILFQSETKFYTLIKIQPTKNARLYGILLRLSDSGHSN